MKMREMGSGDSLQKLTPIRGRKVKRQRLQAEALSERFTEANPDKGTESISSKAIKDAIMSKEFTEANPDKGTESVYYLDFHHFLKLLFTEVNPDKGTETCT